MFLNTRNNQAVSNTASAKIAAALVSVVIVIIN